MIQRLEREERGGRSVGEERREGARLSSDEEIEEEPKQLVQAHHACESLREDDDLQRRLQQIAIQFCDLFRE